MTDITPAMIEAGIDALACGDPRFENSGEIVSRIFEKMAAASEPEPRAHDGRNLAESAPHAAYCDIALQDALIEVMDDMGQRFWMYDDAAFDKSLAGNGYAVMPVANGVPWRPIGSAPKDGTRIIVWRPGAISAMRRIGGDYWHNDCWWHSRADEQPSHWIYAQDIEP